MRVNVSNVSMLRAGERVRVNVSYVPSMGPGRAFLSGCYSRFTVGGQFLLPSLISLSDRFEQKRPINQGVGLSLPTTRFTVGLLLPGVYFSLSGQERPINQG